MNEQERSRSSIESAGPGALGSIFDPPDASGGMATIATGPYAEQLPVAGSTVGEVRARFRDRFDIPPNSQAIIDGHQAGEEAVIRPGQVLMFVHRAGEKGMGRAAAPKLTIQGSDILTVSPEGEKAGMPLAALYEKIAGAGMNTGQTILPDGLKAVQSKGQVTIWVHQSPPRTYNLKWIAADSPAMFGPGTTYRDVRISLPYLIVLAVFCPDRHGRFSLSGNNECFFRNKPLGSLEDELYYPALLNCSKFAPPEGHPLSWICTQHLNRAAFDAEPDLNTRMRLGFKELLHCLLAAGFNYSSEHHESSSWFTESRSVDPRVSSIEAWQEATEASSLFVLDVPWVPTNHSLEAVMQRIFKIHQAKAADLSNASALQRVVFNHQKASAPVPLTDEDLFAETFALF